MLSLYTFASHNLNKVQPEFIYIYLRRLYIVLTLLSQGHSKSREKYFSRDPMNIVDV